MKILCWSCGEPRDTLEEFCPQCGAGERVVMLETIAAGDTHFPAGDNPANVPGGLGKPNKPKVKKGK